MKRVIVCLIALFGVVLGASAGSAPASANDVPLTWKTELHSLEDGRVYYASTPSCLSADAPICGDQLAGARRVIIYLHPAGKTEEASAADAFLTALRGTRTDTIFVYGVSKDMTGYFDGGACCTAEEVDDVDYLRRIVDDLATRTSISTSHVGLMGSSNGGLLALKATCERPDLFPVSAVWAASHVGPCNLAQVRVAQWHGSHDPVIRLNGGELTLSGVTHAFPPVVSVSQRMLKGSSFSLNVLPGVGHVATGAVVGDQLRWLETELPLSPGDISGLRTAPVGVPSR